MDEANEMAREVVAGMNAMTLEELIALKAGCVPRMSGVLREAATQMGSEDFRVFCIFTPEGAELVGEWLRWALLCGIPDGTFLSFARSRVAMLARSRA